MSEQTDLRRVVLTRDEIRQAGRMAAFGAPLAEIAAEFNISLAKADWAVAACRRAMARALEIRRANPLEATPPIAPEMDDLLRVTLRRRKQRH